MGLVISYRIIGTSLVDISNLKKEVNYNMYLSIPEAIQPMLKDMRMKYYSIFPTDLHAVHHLLLVIGNGYEWEDGELVSTDIEDREDEIMITERGWESLQYGDIPLSSFYPVCTDYAKMFNWPDDIKDDWKKLIIDFCRMIIKIPNDDMKILMKASAIFYYDKSNSNRKSTVERHYNDFLNLKEAVKEFAKEKEFQLRFYMTKKKKANIDKMMKELLSDKGVL